MQEGRGGQGEEGKGGEYTCTRKGGIHDQADSRGEGRKVMLHTGPGMQSLCHMTSSYSQKHAHTHVPVPVQMYM